MLAFKSGINCSRLSPAPLGWQLTVILVQLSFNASVPSFLAICRYSCKEETSPVDIAWEMAKASSLSPRVLSHKSNIATPYYMIHVRSWLLPQWV